MRPFLVRTFWETMLGKLFICWLTKSTEHIIMKATENKTMTTFNRKETAQTRYMYRCAFQDLMPYCQERTVKYGSAGAHPDGLHSQSPKRQSKYASGWIGL